MLVSVVIPTFNRLSALERCIAALRAQTASGDACELIVVDDGSRDGTWAWLQQQPDVRLLRVPHCGPAAARNAGVRYALGQVVAFTDDDCTAQPDWIECLMHSMESCDVAGGRVRNAVPANLLAVTAQAIVDGLSEELNGEMRNGGMLTANNLAYRKSIFEAAGGFDERYTVGGEERDLNYRLWLGRARLVFNPQAIVNHHSDPSPACFLRQQFMYGRGALRFYHLSPPPARLSRHFYRRLFRSIGRDHPPLQRALMLAALATSQAAVFCGYVAPTLPGAGRVGRMPSS